MIDEEEMGFTGESVGLVTNIFDIGAVDQHQNMYQAWAAPDVHPNEPQPALSNWHPEDLVAYCGGEYANKSYINKEGN